MIYWSPETGAHVVSTQVVAVWSALGWEAAELGYPTTDQDGISANPIERMQQFQGGAIVQNWLGVNAAVYGRIYNRWIESGGIRGAAGFPSTNESDSISRRGRLNVFEHGIIVWSPEN
ncbi:LGFP repeat protein [Corynebacterium choanae]|uniref:LGFP repeat protein n=1 Tax=Corynebacterium choanae TaxID=1862358 RepID=A0A3G6J3M6_9CORY|nr:LGFP repeat protein [Corynebacterium choanae]